MSSKYINKQMPEIREEIHKLTIWRFKPHSPETNKIRRQKKKKEGKIWNILGTWLK